MVKSVLNFCQPERHQSRKTPAHIADLISEWYSAPEVLEPPRCERSERCSEICASLPTPEAQDRASYRLTNLPSQNPPLSAVPQKRTLQRLRGNLINRRGVGLGKQLDAMYDFHARHSIEAQRGRGDAAKMAKILFGGVLLIRLFATRGRLYDP